jgi:hypothetical protein
MQHWVLSDIAICSMVAPLERSTSYARQPRFTGRGGDGCVREYGVYPLSEIALDFQVLQEHYPMHKAFDKPLPLQGRKVEVDVTAFSAAEDSIRVAYSGRSRSCLTKLDVSLNSRSWCSSLHPQFDPST